MKDPAFLFYSQDFYLGVATLNMEDRGKYITILCLMHQQGRMTEETIRFIVGSISVNLKNKFRIDENGFWYNERLEIEIGKRRNFVESRVNNGKLGGRPKSKSKPKGKPKQNRKVNLSENENENEIVIKNVYKKAVDFYFEYYESKVGLKPPFESREGKSVNEILKYIKNSMIEKSLPVTDESLFNGFQAVFKSLPKFYLEKLDINMIYNNYGKIIAEIRTKSGAVAKNQMQDILEQRKREREAAAAGG
ncbi:MAG TPA: hypothetical protein PKW80_16450 [Bacteroidales bacterium]|nr:hypothetical protein [Bacteroidales bacterium]